MLHVNVFVNSFSIGSSIANNQYPPPLCTDWTWPPGTSSYYRAGGISKSIARNFTNKGCPGEGYRPIYEKLKKAVRWPKETSKDPRLCHDGSHHFLLPAFFKTITELKKRQRSFSIVIRTFGTDIEDVCLALNAYSDGCHLSRFTPPVSEMKACSTNMWDGKYNINTGAFELTKRTDCHHSSATPSVENDETKQVTTPTTTTTTMTKESEIVSLLHGDRDEISCIACTDDYHWWNDHGYNPSCGKPIWITKNEDEYLPIFFDDNIHHDENDSIVAVRVREDQTEEEFRPLTGKETLAMQGKHLVRVPTIAPILNENWFLEKIEECETNFIESMRLQ